MKFKEGDKVVLKTTSKYYGYDNNPPQKNPLYGIVDRLYPDPHTGIIVRWYDMTNGFLYSNGYGNIDLDPYFTVVDDSLTSSIDNLLKK